MKPIRWASLGALSALACGVFAHAWWSQAGADVGLDWRASASSPKSVSDRAALRAFELPGNATPPQRTPSAVVVAQPEQRVTARLQGGLLSVAARDAPLQDVLRAISQAVGVTFVLGDAAREPLSIDIGPMPTQEVIAQVLDRMSYGYAADSVSVDPSRSDTLRMFVVKRRSTVPVRSAIPAPLADARPLNADDAGATTLSRDAALQQQRVTDALLEACKAQACDTS